MNTRFVLMLLTCSLGLCSLGCEDAKKPDAETETSVENENSISLTILTAQAKRQENEIKFNVEVEVNHVGNQKLSIMSNFYSAFDGFELVVLDKAGNEVARGSSLTHQSPSSIDKKKFSLEEKNVKKELTFYVAGIPVNLNECDVMLDGADRYAEAISSPVSHVVIE